MPRWWVMRFVLVDGNVSNALAAEFRRHLYFARSHTSSQNKVQRKPFRSPSFERIWAESVLISQPTGF
jgi:hypothetical protein